VKQSSAFSKIRLRRHHSFKPLKDISGFKIIFSGLCLSLLCACMATGPDGRGIGSTSYETALSASIPAHLKEQHRKVVELYSGVYSHPPMEARVADIMGQLIAASEEMARPFHLTFLDSGEVNAFALSESHLYITRGLLTLANDEAEIASVIAHEMAHITMDHAKQRRERSRTRDLVDQVRTDVFARLNDSEHDAWPLAAFSRQQELAADAAGIRLIAKAGFDPYATARFLQALARFQTMQNVDRQSPNNLTSHPSTPERIEAARKTARQFGAPGLGQTHRERYLKALDGMPFGDRDQDRLIQGSRYVDRPAGFSILLPAGFILEKTDTGFLAASENDLALRYDQQEQAVYSSLQEALPEPDSALNDPDQVQAITLSGMDGLTSRTRSAEWLFHSLVLDDGQLLHRFIMTAPEDKADLLDELLNAVKRYFQPLDKHQKEAITPARITLTSNLSPQTVPAYLKDPPLNAYSPELIYILNNVEGPAQFTKGGLYKLLK
jgi:predicted Zn-dependent protease